GRTALYHAVTFRRYDLVRYLADLGANVSPIDSAGWTPREGARTLGDTRMVSLLDALGATPSPEDSEWAALSSSQNELMLYIGEMCGGPDVRDSAIAKALERVLLARGENYGDIGTSLDFVFEIPGSVYRPNYVGIRTGRLSRKKRMLQIQVSVPSEVINAPMDIALRFCVDALREGIAIASERLAKGKMPFDRSRMDEWVDAIQRRFVH